MKRNKHNLWISYTKELLPHRKQEYNYFSRFLTEISFCLSILKLHSLDNLCRPNYHLAFVVVYAHLSFL